MPLIVGSFHLPVLKLDGGTLPKEVHDSDEVVTLAALYDNANNAAERAGQNSHPRSRGVSGLGYDGKARREQAMDPAQVANERRLVRHLKHVGEAVSLQGFDSSLVIAVEKHVARKEGHHRASLTPARRAAFANGLRQVKREPAVQQVTRQSLLLPRLGMQAPPPLVSLNRTKLRLPESRRVLIGLGWQDWHGATLSSVAANPLAWLLSNFRLYPAGHLFGIEPAESP
jgi:hypothetical protein